MFIFRCCYRLHTFYCSYQSLAGDFHCINVSSVFPSRSIRDVRLDSECVKEVALSRSLKTLTRDLTSEMWTLGWWIFCFLDWSINQNRRTVCMFLIHVERVSVLMEIWWFLIWAVCVCVCFRQNEDFFFFTQQLESHAQDYCNTRPERETVWRICNSLWLWAAELCVKYEIQHSDSNTVFMIWSELRLCLDGASRETPFSPA